MLTKTYPVCKRCEEPVMEPSLGYIVRGDIYSAEIDERGEPCSGLIGPAFPMPDLDSEEETRLVDLNKVRLQCYCKNCLRTLLDL